MKINFNKTLRLGLISILVLGMGIFLFFIYGQANNIELKEEQISVFSYHNKSDVSYKVFLKPNLLFDEESLGEDQIYFTEFIDYISTDFNYEYNGERAADIAGDYEVIAVVEGYTGDGEKSTTVWKKKFDILEKKNFNIEGNEILLAENVTLRIGQYNDFAQEVIESSKVNVSTKLSLLMNINLMVTTDKGIIEEKLSPAIVIPLEQAQFKIQKDQVQEKYGNIEDTIYVQETMNKSKIILYCLILGILIIGLIFIMFYTRNAPPKSEMEKVLSKIFKNHGNRLVTIIDEMENIPGISYKVKSFDDLIRISDEIERPIMYQYSETDNKITRFFIANESSNYIFELIEFKEVQGNLIEEDEDIEFGTDSD